MNIVNLFFMVIVGLIGSWVVWSLHDAIAQSRLKKWTADNNYQILDTRENYAAWSTEEHFVPEPSRYDRIFYVTLLDRDHQRKKAWVRCSTTFLPSRIEVIWDDWATL